MNGIHMVPEQERNGEIIPEEDADEQIPLLMRTLEEDGDIELSKLIFDPVNYRLLMCEGYDGNFTWEDYDDDTKQEWCKNSLYDSRDDENGNQFEINEMVNQMLINGITWQDRLLVARWPTNDTPDDDAQFVVLEGNRRLRAFMRIQELIAAGREVHEHIQTAVSTPRVVIKHYEDPDTLRVEAKTAMSVRHLCGTKNWGPYEDAIAKTHTYEEMVAAGEEQPARMAAEQLGIRTQSLTADVRTIALIENMKHDADYGDRVRGKGMYSLAKSCLNATARNILGISQGEGDRLLEDTNFDSDDHRSFFMRKKYGAAGDEGPERFYGEIIGEADIRDVKKVHSQSVSNPERNLQWKNQWLEEEIALEYAVASGQQAPPSWRVNFISMIEDVLRGVNPMDIESEDDIALMNQLVERVNRFKAGHDALVSQGLVIPGGQQNE